MIGLQVLRRVVSGGEGELTVDELLFYYKLLNVVASPGIWGFIYHHSSLRLIPDLP